MQTLSKPPEPHYPQMTQINVNGPEGRKSIDKKVRSDSLQLLCR